MEEAKANASKEREREKARRERTGETEGAVSVGGCGGWEREAIHGLLGSSRESEPGKEKGGKIN